MSEMLVVDDANVMCPYCRERRRGRRSEASRNYNRTCGEPTCVRESLAAHDRDFGYIPFECPVCTREVTLEMQQTRKKGCSLFKSCLDPDCMDAVRYGQRDGMFMVWRALTRFGPMNVKDLIHHVSNGKSRYTTTSLSQKLRFVPHIRVVGTERVESTAPSPHPHGGGMSEGYASAYETALYEAVPVKEIRSNIRLPKILQVMRRKRDELR